MDEYFPKIIDELSKELNFNYKFLSKDWVVMLEKDDKVRFFSGYKYDLNSQALGIVLDDKYALYDVLKYKKIPVIKYSIIYAEDNKNDYAKGCKGYDYVKSFFYKNGQHVVLKSNNGTCGSFVYQADNLEVLKEIYDILISRNYSINISPFYHIKNEFRTVIVDNKVRLFYKKELPVVVGDGIHSIRELLENFNNSYFKGKLIDRKYDRILANGEKFSYGWKFNLSQGARAVLVDDKEVEKKITDLALLAAKTINMRFGSVDIILTEDDKLFILEINSGIMMLNYIKQFDGYELAKNIYKDAIEKSLED